MSRTRYGFTKSELHDEKNDASAASSAAARAVQEIDRRVYVRVRDAARLLEGLDSKAGLFVPTRLALNLGDAITLAISLPETARAVELPVVVTGRRLPRGAQRLLASGITVRARNPGHPMLALLRDVASGSVVDLNARIQRQQRVLVSSRFPSFDALADELRSLVDGRGAVFPVEDVVYPKDRVRLTAGTDAVPDMLTLEVVVRGLAHHDGRRAMRVKLLGEADRILAEDFLHDLAAPPVLVRR
jgi:hypothetical protein